MDGRHLLSVSQFPNAERLIAVFQEADKTHNKGYCLYNKILGSLFLEPSTRTRLSFESAMIRGGGKAISVADAGCCSRSKGESIDDTVKTMSYYCDIIAMRTSQVGAVAKAAEGSRVPIINGGDGDGEHPTQAILDLYTVWKHFGEINGTTFLLRGDLKYSRTVHSLCKLLKHFDVEVVAWPADGLEWLGDETTVRVWPLRVPRPPSDKNLVIYTTRPQKERWPSNRNFNYDGSEWAITKESLADFRPNTLILHALPRSNELPIEDGPSLGIWKQVQNGVAVRAAIMTLAVNCQQPWRSFGK